MATDNLVAKLYQFPKTILNIKDVALIWGEKNHTNLISKIKYYAKEGLLTRLTRGVYAKNKDYDVKELAASIYTPSYVSFETVLREAGIIFQHYDTVFVASPYAFSKKIGKHQITFRKLKDIVLFNSAGIIVKNNYSIATPERAFLDTIYLFPNYYFDNLESINWKKCDEMVKIYKNKSLAKRLNKYEKNSQ